MSWRPYTFWAPSKFVPYPRRKSSNGVLGPWAELYVPRTTCLLHARARSATALPSVEAVVAFSSYSLLLALVVSWALWLLQDFLRTIAIMAAAPMIRLARSTAQRSTSLLRAIQYTHPPTCPCHANPSHHHGSSAFGEAQRRLAIPVDHSRQKEYAFEMAASSIRFGPGCTKEVGMDFKSMGANRVCVVTDGNVSKLDAMRQVIEGLARKGVEFTVYDKCRVEPKDSS